MLIEANRDLSLKVISKQNHEKHRTNLHNTLNFITILQLDDISSRNQIRQSWEGGNQGGMAYGSQHAQSQGFFQPLDCNPTLQIG